jgi:hypothetical protein
MRFANYLPLLAIVAPPSDAAARNQAQRSVPGVGFTANNIIEQCACIAAQIGEVGKVQREVLDPTSTAAHTPFHGLAKATAQMARTTPRCGPCAGCMPRWMSD